MPIAVSFDTAEVYPRSFCSPAYTESLSYILQTTFETIYTQKNNIQNIQEKRPKTLQHV